MLLNEFFNVTPLNEGGNMFPDSADIPRAAAGTVLANLKKALPAELANQAFATGSAGKKDVSGDMDVMLDNAAVLAWSGQQDQKAAKAALKAALEKAGLKTALSGISVHARVPMGDKFAQVDIMLVDDAATVSKLHQHDYAAMGSTYKGKHKHFILSSAAKAVKNEKFPNGLMWSAFQGLFSRGSDGKKAGFITNDPDQIAKILLNPNASAQDLASPQSIVAAIPKAERDAKLAAAKIDFEKENIPLPESSMKIQEVSTLDTDIDYAPSPDQEYDKKELQAVMTKAMGTLDPKEERVMRMYAFQDMTFDEIGEKYGVSRQRIHDIFMKGIRKLRHHSRNKEIKTFAPESAGSDQLKGTDVAKTVKPKPFAGSQPHPFQGMLVGDRVSELDTRDEDNFTIDDIKQLERMTDLNAMKQKAIELITKPSKKPIAIDKQRWLKNTVMGKKDRMSVIKMMYDLMLGGEGMKVIGSKSSYRQRFGEAENPTDKITMDIPLFLRMMEYAKEDAETDMDLHDVTERAIKLMQSHDWLCMENYDELVGGEATGGEQAAEGIDYSYKADKSPAMERARALAAEHGMKVNRVIDLIANGADIEAKRHKTSVGSRNRALANLTKDWKTFSKIYNYYTDSAVKDAYINATNEAKIKGADGKACWDGYRYAGTVKGKDKCIPVKKSK